MTQPINCSNKHNSAYSGITINITNPTIAPPTSCNCPNCSPQHEVIYSNSQKNINNMISDPIQGSANTTIDRSIYPQTIPSNTYDIPEHSYYNHQRENIQKESLENNTTAQEAVSTTDNYFRNNETIDNNSESINSRFVEKENRTEVIHANQQQKEQYETNSQEKDAYQPQYYLNNYNYVQNNLPSAQNNLQPKTPETAQDNSIKNDDIFAQNIPNQSENKEKVSGNVEENNLNSSKEIIDELDARAAKEKEVEENNKKTKIIALTNEYIMSLENYLNNPNKEIRLMASKEILTRLDEDRDRYDDAALNALLNKMLQDPEKLIRIAALSALSSQLASGNDYTVKLLNDIQNNPRSDKEDVIEAANILLKMSATTEIKYSSSTVQTNNQTQVGENN